MPALCSVFKPLIPAAWQRRTFPSALFPLIFLRAGLEGGISRRGWGKKNTVVFELCGKGTGLHIPLSWGLASTSHATAACCVCDRDGKATGSMGSDCGMCRFSHCFVPFHYMMSQETFTFLAWPQWLLFVKAADEELFCNTLRWGFSACFHEQHDVPGRLLRNCKSEPNSATA